VLGDTLVDERENQIPLAMGGDCGVASLSQLVG
jgi:hypothetical protein